MGKLAVVVAVAALGAAGWAAWSVGEMRKEVCALRGEVEALGPLDARLSTLEAGARAATPPPALPGASRPAGTDAALLAPAPRAGTGSAGATASPSAAARVEELEKRLATLEEKEKSAAAEAAVGRGGPQIARWGGGRAFYATTEDAAKDLDLDPAQKADLDRIVADARRELDDLRKIPDEDGKTYEQLQKEMMEGMRDGALRFDLGKVVAWNGKTIPGRNETFGAAERRARENAKARIRETLRPEQQSKLDRATIDPMLGRGGGPGMVMSFSTVDVGEAPPAPK